MIRSQLLLPQPLTDSVKQVLGVSRHPNLLTLPPQETKCLISDAKSPGKNCSYDFTTNGDHRDSRVATEPTVAACVLSGTYNQRSLGVVPY